MTPPTEEKFFFDKNVFDSSSQKQTEDEDVKEVVEEEIVPLFTEEQLEQAKQQAKKQAYEEGFNAAHQDELVVAEQQKVQALHMITEKIDFLIRAEVERHKLFEEESVRLFATALDKLFPELVNELGAETLNSEMKQILSHQSPDTKINVSVNAEQKSDVEALLSNQSAHIVIEEKDSIDKNQAQISWQKGGAIIDYDKVLQKMRQLLLDRLDVSATNSHDEEVSSDDIDMVTPENDMTDQTDGSSDG